MQNTPELFTRMLDRLLAGPAPYYAADVLGAIDGHIPDLVVCSMFAVGTMVGAEAAGIPYDVLMPNIYALPAPGLPTLGLGGEPAVGPLGRGRDRVITTIVQRQWNKGLGPINQLRNSLGLRPIHDFWDQVRQARKMLVLTSQSFDFPAKLPDNVRAVGPVLATVMYHERHAQSEDGSSICDQGSTAEARSRFHLREGMQSIQSSRGATTFT